jgi:hypothetical protein
LFKIKTTRFIYFIIMTENKTNDDGFTVVKNQRRAKQEKKADPVPREPRARLSDEDWAAVKAAKAASRAQTRTAPSTTRSTNSTTVSATSTTTTATTAATSTTATTATVVTQKPRLSKEEWEARQNRKREWQAKKATATTETGDGKPRLSKEEWEARKKEWEAKKVEREQRNERYQTALHKAETYVLNELQMKFADLEDDVIEARYMFNERTGRPNTNISLKPGKVRSLTNKDFMYNETLLHCDSDAVEKGVETEHLSDVIKVDDFVFTRTKFYENKFFNQKLSEWYESTMNYRAYMRSFTLRGNKLWNLVVAWN